MNKTFLILIIVGFSTVVSLFMGCSSTMPVSNIKLLEFKGVSQVKSGEKATLNWSFANADKVRITELQRNYYPTDSVSISVDSNSTYNFVVTRASDTLALQWRIFVENYSKAESQINIAATEKNPIQSFINSEYLQGMQSAKSVSEISNLKIMRYQYPFDNKNVVRSYGIVLDEFGNYISGLKEKGTTLYAINATTGCSSSVKNVAVSGFEEKSGDVEQPLDFALVLDNSAIADDYYPIYGSLPLALSSVSQNDKFALYNFNQNFTESIPLQDVSSIKDNDFKPTKSSGLSAVFKSLKIAIEKLSSKSDSSRQKVIILISYSTDNASIIYDRNDVIDLAVKSDIPIYVIGIGNAVDSYSLRSVANLTGARYYELEDTELDKISLVINEIIFAQKYYYQFDLPIDIAQSQLCPIINANVEFVTYTNKVRDTLTLATVRERHEFKYMALASFGVHDTLISSEFSESVDLLANVMKMNPNMAIELIGNTSIEGNEKYCYNLGLKRAQAARRALILSGANPSNIRVRSDGSDNPLYYFQDSYWMQYYNRRVEVKWLDPSLLPFEIIAQVVETETEALSNVEDWEDIGYRSYYERYLKNNIPIYRVKIWGFANVYDAESVAKKLTKEKGFSLVVQ